MPNQPLIVRYLVTEDGETGHPMDVCAVAVAVDDAGDPSTSDMARLAELVGRDVRRKSDLQRRRAVHREREGGTAR